MFVVLDLEMLNLRPPPEWDYHELMKGHDVMFTAPRALVLLETGSNHMSRSCSKALICKRCLNVFL